MDKIGKDKLLHYVAGTVIGLSAIAVGPLLALVLVLIAAAGKEVWDVKHGTVDAWDGIATVIGGAVTISAAWIGGM